MPTLSPRLNRILEALPLVPGMRVLEVGCGPGALARAMAARIGTGHVLGIDRSARAVAQAIAGSAKPIADGRLSFRREAAETFAPAPGEAPPVRCPSVPVGPPECIPSGAPACPRPRGGRAPGGPPPRQAP
ncbi:MAG: methyltransferase domain-containing protein, partial [Reyranella sp.]|nr:methyltransferase domain-containing protein [Reyranella sp.]